MSPVDVEAEKRELERLTQAYVKAENDKQVEEMTKFYAPDIISHFPFLPEVRGIEASRKQSEDYMTETGFFTFQTTKIDLSKDGEMAYIAGTYHYTTSDWTADSFYPESSKGKEIVDDGKMLFIWKKIDGVRRIVALTVSSDLPSKQQ